MNYFFPAVTHILAGLCLFVAPSAAQQTGSAQQNPAPAAREFTPRRLAPMFKPITSAPFIPAKEIDGQVLPEELVLGIVIAGQARAYPINMLTGPSREIINDTLAGRAIAATW